MKNRRPFTSRLAGNFERFIAVKRAGGAQYDTQRRLLLTFDRFLCEQELEPPLKNEILTRFLADRELTPRARDNIVSVVWQALDHARRHGAQVERLPLRPPRASPYWRQRQPRIVSAVEMTRLLEAAHQLHPAGGWRGISINILLGLLYVTGIRVGEAHALNVGDLDKSEGILTIVSGKFGKSRALPVRPSTVQALTRYIQHPLRPLGVDDSAPLFVSSRRRRLSIPTMQCGVKTAGHLAKIGDPVPRPHDYRHYADIQIMPTPPIGLSWWAARKIQYRHNQRASRNASRSSSGWYRPAWTPSGWIRSSARSFDRRSA